MIIKYNKYIKESKAIDSYFLQTYEETKAWLDSMYIRNYTINDDLTVDVNDDVVISFNKLKKIPVQFNKVKGDFDCSYNRLTSLKGCPKYVGCFNCRTNNLTSLEYCPIKINGSFCAFTNNITSLKGISNYITGTIQFSNFVVDINDLDSKLLIKSLNNSNIEWCYNKNIHWDDYFEHCISKDINIVSALKDKVSDKIKEKYKHLFNANNFDLL